MTTIVVRENKTTKLMWFFRVNAPNINFVSYRKQVKEDGVWKNVDKYSRREDGKEKGNIAFGDVVIPKEIVDEAKQNVISKLTVVL